MPLSLPHLTTGQLTTAVHWNNVTDAINSFPVSTDAQKWQGSLAVAPVGPHAIGMTVSPLNQVAIGGAFAPVGGTATALGLYTSLNPAPSQTAIFVSLVPTFVAATSGVHPFMTTLYAAPAAAGGGSATVTTACTATISGPPAFGTSRYALLVQAGETRLFDTLTVHQGSTGGAIATQWLADSVSHLFTNLVAANTWGVARMVSTTDGGMLLDGFSEGLFGLRLRAFANGQDTTQTTASTGSCQIDVFAPDGSGNAIAQPTTCNIVVFKNGTLSTHIFRGNGNSYEDGTGWTAYDDYDDLALIESLEYELTLAQGNPIDRQFSHWAEDNRARLEQLELVTFGADGHHFVNRSRMQNLLCGALRQVGRELATVRSELSAVTRRLDIANG